MMLVGVVCSIFAETKVRQFDECTTIVYDTDGNTLKSCYGIIENYYKPMMAETMENKGYTIIDFEEDYVDEETWFDFFGNGTSVEEWKAVKTTVDIYYIATVYTYTVEDGVEYLDTTIVWNDGIFYKMMYFCGKK